MRVKTADLKNNLSHYLRMIRRSGEGIEVCLREEPVAMLVPVGPDSRPGMEVRERSELRRRLGSAGLLLSTEATAGGPLPEITTSVAGDGRRDVGTVAAMRAERDW